MLTKLENIENSMEFETKSWAVSKTQDPGSKRTTGFSQYSHYVTVMKFFLPLMALLLVVAIIIWPQLQIMGKEFSISLSSVKLSGRDSLSMINPQFVGTDRKKQSYSITADIAKNLLKGDQLIELEMPKADIAITNGSWLVLTANTGVYNQKRKILNLNGNVNLFHDSGFEFTTKSADVNLTKGTALSTTPVKGQGPFGHLQAEGMQIEKEGDRIYFSGKSRLTIFPKALKEKK